MVGPGLKAARKVAQLTQSEASAKLGVSQPYLSLLETNQRPVPGALAKRLARVYNLSATALPVPDDMQEAPATSNEKLAEELAGLGYPGFSYLPRKKRNPAEVLFTALGQRDLEPRLTEALPWVVLKYPDLDWNWLVPRVKVNDLQNKLGFVTRVARRLAESSDEPAAKTLAQREAVLDRSRLVREDTLCRDSLTEAEKSWLRNTRPDDAKYWNLLTDLTPEYLSYGR